MMYYKAGMLFFLLVSLVTACGPSEEIDPDTFKVGLLTPGPVSDAGWNAGAYEGLVLIQKELDAEINQIETKTPAEFEQGFRDYASSGYHLVFGHGFEFQDAAAAVASTFPQTVFITTSGTTVRDNVAPVVFEIEQATYLLGMLAAKQTKTGKIGAVGGIEIPSVKSSFDAFKAGAEAVKPDIRFVASYLGNWEDIGAAKEATLALIDQGVDFIFHNADAAGLGVFHAAQEREGIYVFGSNKDQNAIAPNVVLASAVLSIPNAMLTVAQEVKSGEFKASIRRLGMKEDVVSLKVNPALKNRIPEAVWVSIETARQQILAGKLIVPKGF
jgi:basic membrane protein A and related proteins